MVRTNWGRVCGRLLGGCISAIERLINAQPAETLCPCGLLNTRTSLFIYLVHKLNSGVAKFRKARHYMLLACENSEACASVCLTTKNVLSLNFSHNNSSVDDVPSQQVTPFESLVNKTSLIQICTQKCSGTIWRWV